MSASAAHLIDKIAKRKVKSGADSLLQRFGGSLNANLHFHILVLEGGYVEEENGPEFITMDPLRDEDIGALVQTECSLDLRAL
jgi:hypothetical protein